MKLALGFYSHVVVKKVIEKELNLLEISYRFHNSSQIEILEDISGDKLVQLKTNLEVYGIHLNETPQQEFIQKIKDTITELILNDEYHTFTSSSIIAKKLNLSYGHISNLFSEYSFTTLESYIILQKIELAKLLILTNEYTLTEIADKLNYSSVGHLSSQFKKITGMTPTSFIRIVEKRNQLFEVQYLD